jgi:hypothetical protein
VTLSVYAQVIRRPDRDRLRAEMRELLGDGPPERVSETSSSGSVRGPSRGEDVREKARKGAEREL